MTRPKPQNRSLVIVGALLIQISLGAIYAWSVFTKPLVEAGWTRVQTQAVFSAGLAMFAIVMVIAGRAINTAGPRKLAIAGGVVLGTGYALAGLLGPDSFRVMFICVGVIGGSGIGLTYVVPITVGMRWFPDEKGKITGIVVAGFGFGAMLWVKLAGDWGHLIENIGLGTTLFLYGAVFLTTITIGGIWMVFPPDGWKPPGKTQVPSVRAKAPTPPTKSEFDSAEMLGTPQFFLIFTAFLFTTSAGLMCIGLMKLFPCQALEANGVSAADASAIAGTAMAVFFSLANGLGRIGWGIVSDKFGRKRSIFVMTALQGAMMLLFPLMAGIRELLYVGAALIGFNFGGNFALFPTMTADTFGEKNVGPNYAWMFLAYGAGGIFGPVLGGMLGDMGVFGLAFNIVGVMCFAAAAIILLVRHPRGKQ